MKKIIYGSVIALALSVTSCSKDFLETSPTDMIDAPTMLETTDGAQVAMDGIYRMLYTSGWSTGNTDQNFGIMSTKIFTSLMGEDFLQDAQGNGWFYFDYRFDVRSRYTTTTWRSYATWNFYYTLISNANYILSAEETLQGDQAVIDNIMAQAYTIRGYAYHQLIQLFQQTYVGNQTAPGVPIYTEPTSSASEGKGRGTVEEVYTQINSDLDRAIELFGNDKALQTHISHLDYYMANAIKANVALVQNKWDAAIEHSTEALSKPGLGLLDGDDLFSGFNNTGLKSVMWGAQIIADQSTIYASYFSHMDASADRYARSSRKVIYNWLYDQIPSSDVRRNWWNGPTDGGTNDTKPYNQVKFRYADLSADLGDYIFMRAEEMQLVKVEALAHANRLEEAKSELGALMKLRNPDGYEVILNSMELSNIYTMASIGTPKTLMDQIILQRRIELWGEAERIYDIQRLKTGFDRRASNSNHTAQLNWNTMQAGNKEFILTIPQKEFDGNEALDVNTDQNPL